MPCALEVLERTKVILAAMPKLHHLVVEEAHHRSQDIALVGASGLRNRSHDCCEAAQEKPVTCQSKSNVIGLSGEGQILLWTGEVQRISQQEGRHPLTNACSEVI